MAQTLQFEKSYQNVLIPAEPGTSEYLQLIPVGQLLCGEFASPGITHSTRSSSNF
jgi:hypothetical protein